MKILVINGPNINMIGIREPEIYGNNNYNSLKKEIKNYCKQNKIKVKLFQSNCEGEIVSAIQSSLNKFDGIIINPAAFTHTSIAILDALKSVNLPTVEVHISDVNSREEFRKISYIRDYCFKTICGKGFKGYIEAIDALINKLN